jgi:protein-disulfide isomerase
MTNGKYTPVLIVLLIVASFFVGMYFTKATYLEKNLKAGTPTAAVTPSAQQPAAPKIDLAAIKNVFNNNDVIKIGKADSKLLLVEVSDPSCPYCHAASGKNPELSKQIGPQFTLVADGGTYLAPVQEMKKLVDAGKAAFAYIYQNGHGNGEMAMKAFFCANEQGKFWQAHDKLMTNAGYEIINNVVKNDKTASGKLADFLGTAVDKAKLKTCLDSGKYDAALTANQQLAGSLGVNGTPGFFINTTNFAGAYSWNDMKAAAEAALK